MSTLETFMPFPTRFPKRRPPTATPRRPTNPAWHSLLEVVVGAPLVLAAIVLVAVATPLIKLGMWHRLVWDRLRKGDRRGALAVFLFACLAFDLGMGWAMILVWEGELRLW